MTAGTATVFGGESNVVREARTEFFDEFATLFEPGQGPLGQITSPVEVDPATGNYVEGTVILDQSDLTPVADDPTARDIAGMSATTSPSPFEAFLKIRRDRVRKNPALLGQTARQLAKLAWNGVGTALFDLMVAADSTASPVQSHTERIEETGGGTALKIADAYDLHHPDGTTTSNQSNTGSTALSATAIRAALAVRHGYVSYGGGTIMGNMQAPFLIVPVNLNAERDEIRQLVNVTYDGSGLAVPVGQDLAGIITIPYGVASARQNDWGLLWVSQQTDTDSGAVIRRSPFRYMVPEPPDIRFELKNSHWEVHCYMERASVVGANVHTDFYWSTV